MFLHDDVINVENNEASEFKKKNCFIYFVLACAKISFTQKSHLYE